MDRVQELIEEGRKPFREAEARMNAEAEAIRQSREAPQPSQGPTRAPDWNSTEPNLPMPKP